MRGMSPRPLQAIAAYVSELLSEKDASGRQVLVSRLIAILRVSCVPGQVAKRNSE